MARMVSPEGDVHEIVVAGVASLTRLGWLVLDELQPSGEGEGEGDELQPSGEGEGEGDELKSSGEGEGTPTRSRTGRRSR